MVIHVITKYDIPANGLEVSTVIPSVKVIIPTIQPIVEIEVEFLVLTLED
jgi:hypothetical protein